jgi:hypothetical protein
MIKYNKALLPQTIPKLSGGSENGLENVRMNLTVTKVFISQ